MSILDLFKKDDWSNELVEIVGEMLTLGSAMFDYSTNLVVRGERDGDAQEMIYERDKRINHLERKLRRRVVSRLSMLGSRAEIPSALIFMNVVKDGERIGDYTKNLQEVDDLRGEGCDPALFGKWLGPTTDVISGMFATTEKAFHESDEELAGQVIKKSKVVGRQCEQLIRDITGSDISTQNAVCLVLSLRFLKRIVAHLGNIATTVVMPIDLIDYYDEP